MASGLLQLDVKRYCLFTPFRDLVKGQLLSNCVTFAGAVAIL